MVQEEFGLPGGGGAKVRLHPFEVSGLGVAPFQFVDCYQSRGPIIMPDGSQVGAPGQAMGTCQHCGTGIAYCCVILDAHGKRSIVGSTCVEKTADKGLIEATKRKVVDLKRAAKFERDKARITAGMELFETMRETFEARPHPVEYHAQNGKSYADYIDWIFRYGGMSSQLRATRYVEKQKGGSKHGDI